LNRILSILTMSSDPMSNPKHLCGMTFVKLVEGCSIAHLGHRDEPLVTHQLGSVRSDAPSVTPMR
jgi:hypothetical protein